MDITAPQIFELIINISIPKVISILPNISCIGVLGMEKDFVVSANTVDLTLLPNNNPSKQCIIIIIATLTSFISKKKRSQL